MSTEKLENPIHIKPEMKITDERGVVFSIPERRIKYLDDRILEHNIELIADQLTLNEEDRLRLRIINNPALWAETYLANPENNAEPLKLRFYQRDVLETASRFKVMRLGRQCLIGSTWISLIDGKRRRIKNIRPGDRIISFNAKGHRFENDKVTNIWSNSMQPVYKITTDLGRVIVATGNHLFFRKTCAMIEGKWEPLDDGTWESIESGLIAGDLIAAVEGTYKMLCQDTKIMWDKIISIERQTDLEEVFHISVKYNQTFVANELVTHNTGKCVCEKDAISLSNGKAVTAGELYNRYNSTGFKIVAFDEQTGVLKESQAHIESNGVEECILIETRKGFKSAFTANHKAKVVENGQYIDKLVSELHPGELVPVIASEARFTLSAHQAEEYDGLGYWDFVVIAIMTFNGIKEYDTITEYKRADNLIEDTLNKYAEVTSDVKVYTTTHKGNNITRIAFLGTRNRLLEFLEQYNMIPFNKTTSELPDFLYKLPANLAMGFIHGVLICKSVLKRSPQTQKPSLVLEIIHDDYSNKVMTLMVRLGIKAYRKHKYGIDENKTKPDTIYVHIDDPEQIVWMIDKFGKMTPDPDDIFEQYKQDVAVAAGHEDYESILAAVKTKNPLDIKTEITTDEILKIKSIGTFHTYNISVQDHHTYISDGIVTNNSVTLSAEILWRVCNHNNYTVILVCPYLSQVMVIFSRITALMAGSSPIRRMLTRSTQNPPVLEFSNYSTIKGFVAGDSVTGQSANALYYDESDYIGDKEKERINPIVFNFPDHVVVHSSTPTGRRDSFYRMCTENNEFVEFHYPSMVSPRWTPETEGSFRLQYTKSGYEHEVEAIFGDPESGVFRSTDIEQAIELSRILSVKTSDGMILPRSYTYNELYAMTQANSKDKNGRIQEPVYLIGVDWNAAENGTQIVVLLVTGPLLYVADLVSIHSFEFTQTKAIEMLVKLNEKYQPQAIYVDVGFGGMQIEALHLYGKTDKGSKLDKRVIGIDFSKKIEIPDPVTGEITKKRLKQFMVDRLQRLLESQRLVIPEYEDENDGLCVQMRNYEIERYSDDGTPIYSKKQEDHKLMALALATLAYAQLIEKIDRFPYIPGISRISKNLTDVIRHNTIQLQSPIRSRFIDLDTRLDSNRPKTTIADATGLNIPYMGVWAPGANKQTKSIYNRKPYKSKQNRPRSGGLRSRF